MKKAFFEIESSISHYRSVAAVLIGNAQDALDGWTDDERDALLHVDDCESYIYFVIDCKTVITTDAASGDIYGVDSLEDFTAGVRAACSEL